MSDANETEAASSDLRPRRVKLSTRVLDALLGWLLGAKHATYSFAVFRIVYGGIIFAVLATSFPDRHYLWGIGSRFIDPVATSRGYPWFFEAAFTKSSDVLFDISYLILGFLALLFIIGWRTRVVTPLLLLFWVGLSVQSTLLTNGGDTLMRITLFFAVFADLSRHWSVDAWLRRTRKAPPKGLTSRIPSWVGTLAHNTALVLCAYQILLVYATSALLKLQGAEWLDGTAVYYSLSLDVFRPIPWLNDLVSYWDVPVLLATYATLGLQLMFPVFLVWQPTRIVALLGVTGIHLGIGLMLGLWPFSLAMIALDFLFVRDASWRWAVDAAREARSRLVDRWRARRGARAPESARRGPADREPVGAEPSTPAVGSLTPADVRRGDYS